MACVAPLAGHHGDAVAASTLRLAFTSMWASTAVVFSPILRVRTSWTSLTPGGVARRLANGLHLLRMDGTVHQVMQAQDNVQPILALMKPTISAAIGSRMGSRQVARNANPHDQRRGHIR